VTAHTPIRKAAAIATALALFAGTIGSQSAPPLASQKSTAQQAPGQKTGAQQPPAPEKVVPSPARAKKALLEGRVAEGIGDWQAAYNDYSEAVLYAPNDRNAQFLLEFSRYHLAQQHLYNAEREALAGNIERAREEARKAVAIDPGYDVARERLGQIESLNTSRNQAHQTHLAGPITLQPKSGTHTFDVRGDVRAAYFELAKQFELTVNFDTDLANRPTRFRAPAADFETAARILTEETHTFWTPLDEHTIYVAEDTQQKRKQFEQVITQTFVLPNSLTDAEMAETLRLIREMTGITATSFDAASREVTLRDSVQKIGVAEKLIQEIEQGRGEVILEFEFLEVDQNDAQLLGIAPPNATSIISLSQAEISQIENAKTTQQLLGIIQTIFGPAAGGGALGGLLPPLIAFGGGKTFYLSTLPSATVNYSQTLGLVKSAQRLLMRAQDAKPATFFLGERFPITLASFSANVQTNSFIQGALPRTDLLTGASPSAVVTVPLLNNGIAFVTANQGADSISVFIGNGDGTFKTRTDIPLTPGTGPVAIATGDFNNDGNIDLAVLNGTTGTVSILLGDGNGAFAPALVPVTLAAGNGPVAILAGAFNTNNNTNLGLAVVNRTDKTVSVFLGDGTGNFTAAPTIPLAANGGPQAIAAADFNGDGLLDLAVVDQVNNTVSVFLGDGAGNFPTKTDLQTGVGPSAIVAADFNGDGIKDLAITNQTDNTISILLGQVGGTFANHVDIPTGNGPVAILSGDFNGDGIPDLITVNKTDNTVTVLIGDGQGNFNVLRLDVPVATGPVALASADFNGDTRLDLVVACQTANTASVIINTAGLSTPSLAAQSLYPGSEYEDIGLKLKATPRVHPGGDVTLELSIDIKSLSGASINNIPVITNRTFEQTIRVKQDETTLLAGVIDHQESLAISGIPGLALIPGAGLLLGTRNPTLTDTQLLILITPRLARGVPGTGRSIYAGKDSTGRGGPPQ
jgi:type II secretory pathway component GspD/PulD (secretin)